MGGRAANSTGPWLAAAEPPVFDARFLEQFEALLRWRRDVRQFRPEPVDSACLDELLSLAALAPSVGLSEPWRFVWVEDRERRRQIKTNFESCNAEALADYSSSRAAQYARLKLAGLDQAPHHLALFAEAQPDQGHGLGRRTMPETVAYSAVMAAHTLWLAARAHGVGVGWVSILSPQTVAECLDTPANWTFIGYFCLGYPETEHDQPELERQGWERRQTEPNVALRR